LLTPVLPLNPYRISAGWGGYQAMTEHEASASPAAATTPDLSLVAKDESKAVPSGEPEGKPRPVAHGRAPGADRLEELFTTAKSNARATFIAALRRLRSDARVALVLTLRADFYASLMESALWADLDGQLSRLDVSPLRGDKLRMAIEAPARVLGVYFEPVLVERLLHDVADEPGALPLLQDTLLDLWHQRTRGLLRLAEYNAMSDDVQTGLAVTVARRANSALNALSPGRREITQRTPEPGERGSARGHATEIDLDKADGRRSSHGFI